ncbi:YfcE family phosphodiesterase [Terribacillus saccharophilus]|uniref:metallophosphoesterase family protein n=1 Tax=Terribacillus saccharophilus TaxID=361277 RepID=UPI000BA77D58|nr:metallophosphoesterase family protein [Terribacillus saccharophilus]PAF34888.1 YfcE family phosphodiesterase [Terribacillus saccharophilus]
MRIAILTDIHGNLPALQAVIGDIDKRGDIEHIYCLGDMLAIGYETDRVLELLFGRDDISIITGNHDETVLALSRQETYPESHQNERAHHQWITDRTNQGYLDMLHKLPRQIYQQIKGHTVLFTHYHIHPDKATAHISEEPFSRIVAPTLENLELLFQNHTDTELICFGPHHPIHHFRNNCSIFLNPGSLGCQPKPAAPYAIVDIKEEIKIEIIEVLYDNRSFLEGYERFKVPERDIILKIFHGGQL